MIGKDKILTAIENYVGCFPEESFYVERLRTLVRESSNPESRKSFEGHITCGAIVVDQDNRVLKIHHKALGIWLLPGGHLESADSPLEEAARREVMEEVGIASEVLRSVSSRNGAIPLDIDYHRIPENESKAEPEHYHWDFRFLFGVDNPDTTRQVEEIEAIAWAPLDSLGEKLATKVKKRTAEM